MGKLAGGAVADLSDSDRLHLRTLGIKVEQVSITDHDRKRHYDAAREAGKSVDTAGLEAMSIKGGWRSVEPISLETYFVPSGR